MKRYDKKQSLLNNSRGVAMVLLAILMTLLIGIAAIAIDIGYIATTKNELQNIADSAALAATGELGQIYFDNGAYSHGSDEGTIEAVAIDVGQKNRAGGLDITIAAADINIGIWDSDPDVSPRFTLDTVKPNAVRVTVRRETALNGAVVTMFAKIFGVDSIDVSADAVAAITSQVEADPGVIKLPVGLSERQFDEKPCNEPVTFGDTKDSCAGWHIFDEDKVSASAMDAMILGIISGHNPPIPLPDPPDPADPNPGEAPYGEDWFIQEYPDMSKIPPSYMTPGVPGDDPDNPVTHFNYQGGTIASLFNEAGKDPAPIQALFDYWKTRDLDVNTLNNGVDVVKEVADAMGVATFDEDDVWVTTVPVYDDGDPGDPCSNPTGMLEVIGVADVVVWGINPPPDNSLDAVILCSYRKLRGDGGTGGNTGIIPTLVE